MGSAAPFQPHYAQEADVAAARESLAQAPALVSAAEIRSARGMLRRLIDERGFMVQGGECAERFSDLSRTRVVAHAHLIDMVATELAISEAEEVVRVGRIAGQFAKPRTLPNETREVEGSPSTLPSYAGDVVHEAEFTRDARTPDPKRLVIGAEHAREALATLRRDDRFGLTAFASHELLVFAYEAPFVRDVDGECLLTSTHIPWVGDRTRAVDGAHVVFLSRIGNARSVKLGPTATTDEVVALARTLGGRVPLAFITRLGAEHARVRIPEWTHAVRDAGVNVAWMCDPMHANTRIDSSGRKIRYVEDLKAELEATFVAHREASSHLAGVHLEWTIDEVSECVGDGVDESEVAHRYRAVCDPRLNPTQTIAIARYVRALRTTPA